MKYIVLFGASFVFIALRHFSNQRNKQWELDRQEFKAAAERAEQREQQQR